MSVHQCVRVRVRVRSLVQVVLSKCLQHPDKSCCPSKLKAPIEDLGNLSLCSITPPLFSRAIYCVDVAATLRENKYIQIHLRKKVEKMKLLTMLKLVSPLSSLFPHAVFG